MKPKLSVVLAAGVNTLLTIFVVGLFSFSCSSSAWADSIEFSPDLVDFGSVPFGTSSEQSFTASINLSSSHSLISFSPGSATSPFTMTLDAGSSACSASNLACVYDVTFAPTTGPFFVFSSVVNFTLVSCVTQLPCSPAGFIVAPFSVTFEGLGITASVPGPIAGTGMPGVMAACGGPRGGGGAEALPDRLPPA